MVFLPLLNSIIVKQILATTNTFVTENTFLRAVLTVALAAWLATKDPAFYAVYPATSSMVGIAHCVVAIDKEDPNLVAITHNKLPPENWAFFAIFWLRSSE